MAACQHLNDPLTCSSCRREALEETQSDLIEAVRSWANADCGAKEADEVLACLARFDDLRAKP